MDKSNPITRQLFAEDRTYKREVVQLDGLETTLKLGSIFPKIKRKSELDIFLKTVPMGTLTDGISVPIYSAGDLLSERVLRSKQTALGGGLADIAFANLLEATLIIDPVVDALSYASTVEDYVAVLRFWDNRLQFPQRILHSFNRDEEGKLVRNVDAYNEAWAISMGDARERIRLCQGYVFYPFRLGSRLPAAFTRTIEHSEPESLIHAALLNKESNLICKSNKLPKILSLSIGRTALSSRSFIKEIIDNIVNRNAFGNSFDLLHLSLPNNDIHGNSAQRKNFMMLYSMVSRLKYEHGVKPLINDVDIALAEASMGMGFAHAITPLDGNTSATHFAKYDKENKGYGKAPIPADLDWLPFGVFTEEYSANGRRYPYYSVTARSLDNHKDLRRELTAGEWNPARKTIFAEFIEDINGLNLKAAHDKEFVEGVRKRISDSNKKNYTDLLKDVH